MELHRNSIGYLDGGLFVVSVTFHSRLALHSGG